MHVVLGHPGHLPTIDHQKRSLPLGVEREVQPVSRSTCPHLKLGLSCGPGQLSQHQVHQSYFYKKVLSLHLVLPHSSEPHGHLVDEEDGEEGNDNSELKPIMDDGVIKVFEDHEESVYAAAW